MPSCWEFGNSMFPVLPKGIYKLKRRALNFLSECLVTFLMQATCNGRIQSWKGTRTVLWSLST